MQHWYAVFTKPRQELAALDHLQRQGFESYLPMTTRRCIRRAAVTLVDEPVFPRYLFVRVDLQTQNTASVRSTRGVVGFVRFGSYTPPVPQALIDHLRAGEQDRRSARPRLRKGERVQVAAGPLAGMEGIMEMEKGEDRVMLLLDLLGRQNRVVVPVRQVLPVEA